MMGWSRNMNYVGEIMLYAAFGVLVQCNETWMIYSYMWGIVFMMRMTIKDYSLMQKDGWFLYNKKSWMLIPKIGGKRFTAWVFYILASLFVYTVY